MASGLRSSPASTSSQVRTKPIARMLHDPMSEDFAVVTSPDLRSNEGCDLSITRRVGSMNCTGDEVSELYADRMSGILKKQALYKAVIG